MFGNYLTPLVIWLGPMVPVPALLIPALATTIDFTNDQILANYSFVAAHLSSGGRAELVVLDRQLRFSKWCTRF